MIYYVDNTTNKIVGATYGITETDLQGITRTPDNCRAVLNNNPEIASNQGRYIFQPDDTPVLQSYITLDTTISGNQYTLTATVSQPTSTVDFTVENTLFSQPVINNQAILITNLDDVVSDQKVRVSVNVSGFVGASVELGGENPLTPSHIVKSQVDGSIIIKCTSRKEIKEYGLTINVPEEDREADESNMLDFVADGVFKMLQCLQNPTYTPLNLTADEQNAITDFVANYQFRLRLSDAKPVVGSTTAQNPRYPLIIADKTKANTAANTILSRLADPDTINP